MDLSIRKIEIENVLVLVLEDYKKNNYLFYLSSLKITNHPNSSP